MNVEKLLQSLGIGLSRALRYSFPGILLGCAFALVDPSRAKSIYEALGLPLSVFSILVIGIGLYATHRSLIIPVHHFLGCILLWTGEKLCNLVTRVCRNRLLKKVFRTRSDVLLITSSSSLSPTHWLASLEIPRFRRMLAYRELRHYWFTKEETEALDVMHAENGLPVILSEAIVAAGIYSWKVDGHDPTWPLVWGIILFLLSALSGMQEHRVECAHFKADTNRAKDIVKKFKNP